MKPLVLEKVSKMFGGLEALCELSLEIQQGERRVIIGPNGAGKTTLFNLIGGQLHQTSGKIYLFGREVTKLLPYQRATLGLSQGLSDYQSLPQSNGDGKHIVGCPSSGSSQICPVSPNN